MFTAYGLGPMPTPAPGARASVGLVPAGGDFWRSPAFGLLLLALLFVYFRTRIL